MNSGINTAFVRRTHRDFTHGDSRVRWRGVSRYLPPLLKRRAGGVCDAGRVSAHTLARYDAMVDTVFVRHRQRFMSSALRAFLACASDGIVTAWAA